MTRPPISEMPSVIDESDVFKLISNFEIDSIEHHFKDAFKLNQKVFFLKVCSKH